jgi:hypothetical protein
MVTRRRKSKAFLKRSAAAKKGWKTRKRNETKKKKRRFIGGDVRRRNRFWLIAIEYRKRKGRSFSADLVIIGPSDWSPTELADYARAHLPEGKTFLANWVEGAWAEITQGELTSRQLSAKVRSFVRHKT